MRDFEEHFLKGIRQLMQDEHFLAGVRQVVQEELSGISFAPQRNTQPEQNAYLGIEDAAKVLGVVPATLAAWRVKGAYSGGIRPPIPFESGH